MILRKLCILIAAACLLIPAAFAVPTAPTRLTFEVVSIKPSQPNGIIHIIKPLEGGNGYTSQNMPVKLMIALMYKVPMRQVIGGPDWIDNDPFDIEAKADGRYSIDDLHVMFQNLIVDRFNLKFHMETREGPVYAMTVDKSGLKMKANGIGQAMAIPILPGTPGEYKGTQVPMKYLTWWLGQQLQNDGRPVIDQTGLSASYDFTLSFAPQLPPNVSKDSLPAEMQNLPSIFDAVKDQLGLKLEAAKGPVEYFVIDHIERPSAN